MRNEKETKKETRRVNKRKWNTKKLYKYFVLVVIMSNQLR